MVLGQQEEPHLWAQGHEGNVSVGAMVLQRKTRVLGLEEHAGVVTRGLPVSSVPVLLHSCLRRLHCFPLHPHRLVLSLSRVPGDSGPQEWVGIRECCVCCRSDKFLLLWCLKQAEPGLSVW